VAKQIINNFNDPRLESSIDQTPNLVPEFIMNDKLSDLDKYDSVELNNYIQSYDTAREQFRPTSGSPRDKKLEIGNYDLNNPDHFDYLMRNPKALNPNLKKNIELKDPYITDKYSVNYDRYFMHPKFDELGFNPMFNMEQYYNENSDAWDDLSRTVKATWGTIKGGYLSAPRSVMDLFDGDAYFDTPDFQTASEFAESTRIAQSTRGGMTGFLNNTFNQLGYSIGMIGEILTEEAVILGAATAASSSGVGLPAGVMAGIAGTFRNIGRLGKIPGAMVRQARIASEYLSTLKNVDAARDFYNATKSGGKWAMDRLTPNTVTAFQTSRVAQKMGDKVTNLALAANTFGGFYRDMRALNFAVSEGKLEAGLRYSDQVSMLAEMDLAKNNGEPLTAEQVNAIHDNALGAAMKTLHWNIPAIYLTNQLVFGKALRGFNPKIAKIFEPTKRAFSKDLTKTAIKDKEGKIIKDLFEDVTETKTKEAFGKRIKNIKLPEKGQWASAAKGAVHSTLRFTAANLGEGSQELYQEAISAGFGEYYKDLYKDPALAEADSILLDLTYAAKGTKAEGFSFETFASGFVVGGVMSGVSTFAMEWVPTKFSEFSRNYDETKANAYNEKKKEFKDLVNNASTTLLSDRFAVQDILSDPHRTNMTIQNEASREMRGQEYVGDELAFTDARDNALFNQLRTIEQSGSTDAFIDKLNDIKNLEDTDLIDYLKAEGNDGNEAKQLVESGKYRNNIDKTVKDLEKLGYKIEDINAKYPSPINLSKYDKEKNPAEYYNALRNHNIWEHSKMLYLFTSDGFDKARERSAILNDRLKENRLLDKISASDISSVTDKKFLDAEINILKTEIRSLEEAEDKTYLKDKKRRLELLENYKNVLTNEKNVKTDGYIERNETTKKEVSKALKEYFTYVGSLNNDYIKEDEFQRFVTHTMDRFELDSRAAQYSKTLEFLNKPENFIDVFDRVSNSRIADWLYAKDSLVNAQMERLDRRERGSLINDFQSLEVYPDPDQVKEFLETGDASVLETFYSATRKLMNLNDGSSLANQIKLLIAAWKIKEVIKADQVKAEQETVLAEATEDQKTDQERYKSLVEKGPVINAVFKSVFENRRALNDAEYLTINDWANSTEGKKIIKGLGSIKELWFNGELVNQDNIDSVYAEDLGFLDWFKNNQTNPDVQNILNESGLIIEDFILGVKPLGTRTDFVKTGPNINIQKTEGEDPDTGNTFTNFRITDNKGNRYSNNIMPDGYDQNTFLSLEEAKKVFDLLLPKFKNDSYQFGNLKLKFKDLVSNREGKQFIFYGTSDEAGKGNQIVLLPYEQRNLKNRDAIREASILEPVKGFESRGYSRSEEVFASYDNISKLYINELVGSMPFKKGSESWDTATAKFKRILSLLTAEDISNVRLIISKNTNDQSYRDFILSGGNANTFIKTKANTYNIAIKLSKTTIDSLKERGLEESIITDLLEINSIGDVAVNGLIGFIRNGTYKLVDGFNIPINPFELSDNEIAKKYLKIEGSDKLELQAERFRNAYVQQVYLQHIINTTKFNTETGVAELSFKELQDKGLSLNVARGQFVESTDNKNKLSELDYSTYEGSGVILIGGINFETGDVTDEIIVSSDVEEIADLKQKVRAELKGSTVENNSNLYNQALFGKGRYVAILKQAGGQITLAELQQEAYTEENLTELFKELIDKAIETKNNNVAKDNTAEDKGYNKLSNEEFNAKVFVASKPGSQIQIKVSPTGIIELEFYNHKESEKRVRHGIFPDVITSKYQSNPLGLLEEFKIFAQKINNEYDNSIIGDITFDAESFRVTFSKEATFEEIADKTVTSLSKNVSAEASEIRIEGDPSKINAMANTLNDYIKTNTITQAEVNQIPVKVASANNNGKSPLNQAEETYVDRSDDPFNANAGVESKETTSLANKKAEIERRRREEILNRKGNTISESEVERRFIEKRNSDSVQTKLTEGLNYTNGNVNSEKRWIDKEDAIFEELIAIGVKPDNRGVIDNTAINKAFSENESKIRKEVNDEIKQEGLKRVTDEFRKQDDTVKFKEINAKYDAELKALNNPAEQPTQLNQLEVELKNLQEEEQALFNNADKEEDPRAARRKIKPQLEILRNKQEKVIKAINAITLGIGKTGNKLVASEAIAVDVLVEWVTKNLPDFIDTQDIRELGVKLKNEGINVGQFSIHLNNIANNMKVAGTIYTGAPSTVLYHESFHAVFRLLLTPEQQDKFLAIAKKAVKAELRESGLSLTNELNQLREQYPKYKDYTNEELEKVYYEEWMADQFERFKINPKSSSVEPVVKSWFNRIKEWIKAILNRFSKNELSSLFDQIDSGKFKDAPLQSNEFTRHGQEGVTLDVYKNLTKSFGTSPSFLDPLAARDLIKLITGTYITRAGAADDYVVEDILDDLIYDYEQLYKPSNEVYAEYSEIQKQQLKDIYDTLRYQGGQEVKDGVTQYINAYISKIDKLKDVLDDLDASLGGRTTDQFDLDAANIGGHSSLPFKIRVFIATQTITNTDTYGNPRLDSGELLRVPVNFEDVFYGFTKSMSNKENPIDMIKSAYFFSKRNKQTRAVLENLFKTVNLDLDAIVKLGKLVPLNSEIAVNSQFFQQFIKSFRNEKLDYFVIHKDPANGNVIQYSAAIRDAAKNQIIGWRNNWFSIYSSFNGNTKAIEETRNLLEKAQQNFTKINTAKALDTALYIKDAIGVELSPSYIEFSMLMTKDEADLSAEEKAFVDLNKNDVDPITLSDLVEITKLVTRSIVQDNKTVYNPANIFAEEDKGDATTRITKFANNNALMDESIGVTVFLNAENNLVNAHQMPTFHLTEVRKLNNENYLAQKVAKSDGFLDSNFLFQSAAFKELQKENKIKVFSVDGQKIGNLNRAADVADLDITQRNHLGTKYGSLKATDFLNNLIELYLNSYNNKNNSVETVTYVDSLGNKNQKGIAPVNIRVMETANKGDFVSLPIVKAVQKKDNIITLTDEALNFFYNDIANEFNRIKRELNRHFPDGVITDNVDFEKLGIDRITGYNTLDKQGQIVGINKEKNIVPKAFKFFQYTNLLGDNFAEDLEKLARTEDTFEDAFKSLGYTKAQIQKSINNRILDQVNLAIRTIDPKNLSKLIKSDIAKSKDASLLNLTDDVNFNLSQIFINDWINTTALNDLLLGDQSRLYKDPAIDATKRSKANNGSMVNVESYLADADLNLQPLGDGSIQAFLITDKILKSSLDDANIDSTDAQVWGTLNAYAHFLNGLGEITPSMRELIKKINNGTQITSEEWEKYKKDKAIFNSEKFLYFDGETYIKMSFVPLIKELTTDKEGNAIQGREALHNLRLSLEASEKAGKVSLAVPQTASKMLQKNVTLFDQATSNENALAESKPMLLNARHFGRQMVVPSNKTEITSISQIKTLITSEHYLDEEVIINGESISIKKVLDRYNELAGAGVTFNYNNRKALLFDLLPFADNLNDIEKSKMYDPNMISFLKYAQDSLKRAHASGTTLEFFSLQKELSTQFQKYELNTPLTIDKFEDLFISFFGSKIIKEKVEGHSLALVSLEMLIPRTVYNVTDSKIDRQKAIRQTQFDNSIEVPATLRADNYELDSDFANAIQEEIEKTGGPVIILDRLRANLKEYADPTDASTYTKSYYSEVMYASHYTDVTDKIAYSENDIPDVIAKSQAVRVPSQDKHSAMNVKLVDFLPVVYGSTGSFAKEIVQITGADFDIDKAYLSVKDWYVDEDGKFIEYGASSRNSKGDNYNLGFKDYAKYVNKIVSKSGSYLAEALFKYQNNNAPFQIKYDAQITMDASRALSILNLPTNLEEYKTYREKNKIEPYNAAINNESLDMKLALLGNEGMSKKQDGLNTPIAYTPLAMDPIELAYDYLNENINSTISSRELTGININNPLGKYRAWKTVKEASGAIGTVVVPNLVINALTAANVSLYEAFTLNGQKYQSFGDKFVKKQKGAKERAQTTIDALVSAVVDDAKYNYLSRLGLNKPALRVATYMSGLGVPLNTTLLLLNIPDIQFSMSDGISIDNDSIKETLNILKTSGLITKEYFKSDITENEIIDLINNDVDVTLEQDLENTKRANVLYAALLKFQNLANISSKLNKLVPFFNLIADGHESFEEIEKRDASIQELGLDINNNKTYAALAEENNLPVDFRPLFKKDKFLSSYYDIHKDFTENVLPNIFVTYNKNFLNLYSAAKNNFKDDNLKKNILSYFISKAYINKVETKLGSTNSNPASLTNAFLYDREGQFNIVSTLEALKQTDPDKRNYFLNNYLFAQKATAFANNTNMNLVKSNTFGRVSDDERLKIQEGFQRIFVDPKTHREAVDFIHNQLVKDGLQFSDGSLIESMSATTLESILSSASDVMKVLNNIQDAEEVFGMSLEELQKDFLLNYGESISSFKAPYGGGLIRNINENQIVITNNQDEILDLPLYYAPNNITVYRLNDNLINDDVLAKGVVRLDIGGFAEYNLVEQLGSFSQNPMGFVFGERPLYKELDPDKVQAIQIPAPKLEQALQEGSQIIATETSIELIESKKPVVDEFGGNVGLENNFGQLVNQPATSVSQSVQSTNEFKSSVSFDPFNANDFNPTTEASKQSDDNSVSLQLNKFHSEKLLGNADRLNEIRNKKALDIDTAEKFVAAYKTISDITTGYTVKDFTEMIEKCYISK
jgi:hypothetical protein